MTHYIKLLYNKWFNSKLFKQNKDDDKNYIIFSINPNGDVNLEILLHSNQIADAYSFGDLLYGLNNGIYADQMVTTLTEVNKTNSNYINFVHAVILRWHTLLGLGSKNENNKFEPIIKPSQFGGSSK